MHSPTNSKQYPNFRQLTEPRAMLGFVLIPIAAFVTLVYRPSGDFFALFLSWQHLICCVALGLVCQGLDCRVSAILVSGFSVAVVGSFFGTTAIAYALAQTIAVWIAVRFTQNQRNGIAALAVSLVLAAGLYGCWRIGGNRLAVLGIWVYALLRNISFAVDVRRGSNPGFLDFACYMFYYPALLQTEQYADFSEKNLYQAPSPDYIRAARRFAAGWVKTSIAVAIPFTFDDVVAIETFFGGWGTLLTVYLRAVLFVTGAYDCIQAVSSLHGLRIRENFPGVLLARNPSDFWRRWRATMTEFFITYIYIPLGGRNHRKRNIVAVFATSVLWHWIGVPFFGGRHFIPDFLPVLLFGVFNATVMIIATEWRSLNKPKIGENEVPGFNELAMLATAVFGSMTVLLLTYTPQNAAHAIRNLSVLFPMLRWLPL